MESNRPMAIDLVTPLHQYVLPVLAPLGFRAERGISNGPYAVIVAPVENLAAYVIAKERGKQMWIGARLAPRNFPDGQIINPPGISYEIIAPFSGRVRIAEQFAAAANQVLEIAPRWAADAKVVQAELEQLATEDEFLRAHVAAQLALATLQSLPAAQQPASMANVVAFAREAREGSANCEELPTLCDRLVKDALDLVPALADPAFAGRRRVLARSLAGQIYIDAVCS